MEAKLIRLFYGALINLTLRLLGNRGLYLQKDVFLMFILRSELLRIIFFLSFKAFAGSKDEYTRLRKQNVFVPPT